MPNANTIIKSTDLRPILFAVLFLTILLGLACRRPAPASAPNQPNAPADQMPSEPSAAAQTPTEMSLFDGKSLGQWKITDFGGQGNVDVNDGAIYLEMGSYMTGVTWTGPVIQMNYEISLDAMRVMGSDFFCGLTFPVADKPCSLILGGWGGSLCGLSNIDYYDAANNETTKIVSFENGKWYHVRLRVTTNKIEAWLDSEEEKLVDIDITDRHISIRPEMDLCQPLGVATFATTGAIRNINVTKLSD